MSKKQKAQLVRSGIVWEVQARDSDGICVSIEIDIEDAPTIYWALDRVNRHFMSRHVEVLSIQQTTKKEK